MFKSYLKIAIRNIYRHKAISFINIAGLSIGMACTILILLWVSDELSYDKFHKNSDKIYLVLRGENNSMSSVTSKLLAPALKNDVAEVENATSFMQAPSTIKILVKKNDLSFEENFSLADEEFFKVFTFEHLNGRQSGLLKDPYSVVITENISKKYFGISDALGKTLDIMLFGKKHTMRITAVLKNLPSNSHIRHQFIFPVNMLQTFGGKENGWRDQQFETFIRLKNSISNASGIKNISSQIRACELRNIRQNQNLNYSLIPLTDIHLYGNYINFLEKTGNIEYVKIFSVAAIIILLIASINYTNLSTALSLKRTKEVGIKKTVGANRKSLIMQFFGESLLISFLASVAAVFITELFLPSFNELAGKNITLQLNKPGFITGIFTIVIITAFFSGLYPAIFLSSFKPLQVLKEKIRVGSTGLGIRKALVVFQFSLSAIMIICTIIVYKQLGFIQSGSKGLNKENLLCINMTGDVNRNYSPLRNELSKIPGVVAITRSEALNNTALSATGVHFRSGEKNEELPSWVFYTDTDMSSVYKLNMKKGRFFSEDYPADKSSAFIINETAAKQMGLSDPLDKELYLRGRLGKIIGVTEDFHFSSFRESIEPLVFMIPDSSQEAGRFRIITIRYKAEQLKEVLYSAEKTWKNILGSVPFNYYFFDDSINQLHNAEIRMSVLFEYFSFVSILLACTGLFGLVSISTEQRTKEIGIRKVLGASIPDIIFLVGKEYMLLIFVANLVAFPAAYYFMKSWLNDFAYRIDITWFYFGGACLLTLFISLITIGAHVARVAAANPVQSLKYE